VIAALYVQRGGVYWDLPDVDPWDEARDARLYAGPWPVVAHPPCARWSVLAGLVESKHPHLKRGKDDGCFASALTAVRIWGGVLEHPAFSAAFAAYGLPRPPAIGWQRTMCGGWVAQVEQRRYGHKADKATWLFAHGVREPPSLRWGRAPGLATAVQSGFARRRKGGLVERELSKRERSATPLPFRDLLLSIARSAERRAA
jgi:hypothetical protein